MKVFTEELHIEDNIISRKEIAVIVWNTTRKDEREMSVPITIMKEIEMRIVEPKEEP